MKKIGSEKSIFNFAFRVAERALEYLENQNIFLIKTKSVNISHFLSLSLKFFLLSLADA